MTLTTQDKIDLGNLTTYGSDGKHFIETYGDVWLDRMEEMGMITIDRPVHAMTGIPYSQEYWTVEVIADKADLEVQKCDHCALNLDDAECGIAEVEADWLDEEGNRTSGYHVCRECLAVGSDFYPRYIAVGDRP